MSIKRIFSAGGIVVRPSKTLAKEGRVQWEVLVTQHSKHKGWDFPKGHLETGETNQTAAIREVEEETGIRAEVIEKVGQTQYFYFDAGERVLKTVNYFLMKFKAQGKATTAFEVSDKIWLPVSKIEGKLTFKSTKSMWGNVRNRIEQLVNSN